MASKSQQKRPNFLIVVADDLGFSDISPYGGEIETPTLQRLANDGVRMTNFHTAAACSPTRAMLMSGTDNHIAGLGQLVEHMQYRDKFEGRPGYEGYLNFQVAALPEILKDQGYHTVMSGKWHLGMKQEHSPHARGFQKCFSFLAGCGNHFNYEPQFDHPTIKLPFRGRMWMQDDQYVDRKDPAQVPDDFFSTDFISDKMVDYLKERTDEEKEKPFFAYLPYLAPHWPLQAPKEVRQKYKGFYDDGPTRLGEKRVQRLKELGLVPEDVVPAQPAVPVPDAKTWATMTAAERAVSARSMEVYAAMVDGIDQGLGRVIDHLESTGELDNTFILFMSDNGAEGMMLEALHGMGPNIMEIIDIYYNNKLENIGEKDSFVWYGPEWASAATAPSRGWKTWPTEGGIRCPCIVRYPKFLGGVAKPGHTHSNPSGGGITHKFTTVMDILPTVLELALVPPVGEQFQGRQVVPVRGKSWVSHLRSGDYEATEVHDGETHVHGWELIGLRAIRRGPWKAVWMNEPRGRGEWELYQVEKDPGELNDLAASEPDKLEELKACWQEYYQETGMFDYGFDFAVATA